VNLTRRLLLCLTAGLMLGLLSCQVQGITLPGPVSATVSARQGTQQALATRMGSTARVVSTGVVLQATATAEAREAVLLQRRAWPAAAEDDFSENRYEWPEGEDSSSFAEVTYGLVEGRYRMVAQANESFYYWSRPTMPAVTDFYLAVDAHQLAAAPDAVIGVIFRWQDTDNFYVLQLDEDGYFSLYRAAAEGWVTLIPWQATPALRPGEANRVEISMVGPDLLVYVNETQLLELTDAVLESGRVGVYISMFNEGDSGIFEFDNLELRALPESILPEESGE
jgi:hypothetical protein